MENVRPAAELNLSRNWIFFVEVFANIGTAIMECLLHLQNQPPEVFYEKGVSLDTLRVSVYL